MSLCLANVIWPFFGAFYAQFIPFFLLLEWLILVGYFKKPKAAAFGWVLLANVVSTLGGVLCLSLVPFPFGWEPLVTRASDQYHSCIVAFLLTVPLEYLALGFSKHFVDKRLRFRAVFLMNFATYAICIAVVTYHWTLGQNAHWDELFGEDPLLEKILPDSKPDSGL